MTAARDEMADDKPREGPMFNFKVPGSAGYLEAIRKARLVVALRREIAALASGPMIEFDDTESLGAAIDAEIGRQRAEKAAGQPTIREPAIRRCAKCGAHVVGHRLAPCCIE